ncbi:MAG: NAD-dependent epimerase/dehydratase family protein [Spirochaetes bacterium]|nr:NAD-dependent epimerase/dehydratase family protein [Spirochaetota bacterium]
MKNILITGSNGFIGKNLKIFLKKNINLNIIEYDINSFETLDEIIKNNNFYVIYHLAGVNRPQNEIEYFYGNVELTNKLINFLEKFNKVCKIVFSSSIQAELDNLYGKTKKEAEELLLNYSKRTGNKVYIYRFQNVFGKWCKPNYNSVVATFCYNLTHNKEIIINDPEKVIKFIYIDDVIKNLIRHIYENDLDVVDSIIYPTPFYEVSLAKLAELLKNFIKIRENNILPNFENKFEKYLYSTLISYYDLSNLEYKAIKNEDNRGYLFEFIKSNFAGQIFISRTKPGITRGNHYHHTKVEKFCVVEGKAKISFRNILNNEKYSIIVDGEDCKIVDIPPGYTHNITNIGDRDLITVFWANEIFDPDNPDTYYEEV